MDRRTFLRLSLGAAGAVILEGCTNGKSKRADGASPPTRSLTVPQPRPTLRLAGSDAGFPSPFSYFPTGHGLMLYIYDTLLWAGPDQKIVPWLAERHQPAPDGLVHRFELRPNARWHDGKPVEAADVEFSFEYFAANKSNLPPFLIGSPPPGVAEVRATGPRTVEVRLDQPHVTFTRALKNGPPIFPRHVWSSIPDPAAQRDLKLLVGSGPYRLESYSSTHGTYLFVANDDFFVGKPFVKRLEMVPVGDSETDALNALLAGEIHAAGTGAGGLSPGALRPFRQDDRFAMAEAKPDFAPALAWNMAKGGALADVRFRRACALAIDRAELVERVLGGMGEPGNPGLLPPEHPFRVDVEQYPFNRAAAERLLDQAGYRKGSRGVRQAPDGRPLRFKLLALPPLAAATELVVEMLRRVGIVLEIDPVDPGQAFEPITKGNYEMAILFYAALAGSDPNLLRTIYSSKAEPGFFRIHGYADAEFDALADQQLLTADEAERRRLLARMQHIVARDVPLLPLYYSRPVLIYRRDVFDQMEFTLNKQVLVTGVRSGGFEVRPSREEG